MRVTRDLLMVNDISFRNAVDADIEDIVAIENECFTDAWSAESFRSSLANPFCEVIVCQRDGYSDTDGEFSRIVAHAVMMHMYEQGEIAKVAVARDFRRQGIASRLVDWLLKIAEHEDVENVFLDVRQSNTAARALYEKAGFTPYATAEAFYKSPVEAAVKMIYSINENEFAE